MVSVPQVSPLETCAHLSPPPYAPLNWWDIKVFKLGVVFYSVSALTIRLQKDMQCACRLDI